jgi:hypothetical protein
MHVATAEFMPLYPLGLVKMFSAGLARIIFRDAEPTYRCGCGRSFTVREFPPHSGFMGGSCPYNEGTPEVPEE